jgi:hypothetical protein
VWDKIPIATFWNDIMFEYDIGISQLEKSWELFVVVHTHILDMKWKKVDDKNVMFILIGRWCDYELVSLWIYLVQGLLEKDHPSLKHQAHLTRKLGQKLKHALNNRKK